MSYYENQQWPAAASQAAWDQQTPPARSGASSAVPREDPAAFGSQLEEVDRAIENLFKSGKIFNMPPRRDPMPLGAGPTRSYPDFDPRIGNSGASRHSSVSDFGDARSYSGSNLQNFYASARHQPPRASASEAEQVIQAKRRIAAQRERELRNYHQEQQYNRTELSTYGGKPDRTISPGSGMSEEERRDLIARQRSALYGEGPFPDSGGFSDENGTARPGTQGSNPAATRHSPLGFAGQNGPSENGNEQGQSQGQSQSQQQQRSRANSTSSPSSNQAANFALFDAQQSSRTSTSSPGGSPPRQGKPAGGPTVAPIGTRPAQVSNPALSKRSTTPLPSPLSHGFAATNEENGLNTNGVRATTTATANSSTAQDAGLGWGSKSTVWGNKNLGVQASVWG